MALVRNDAQAETVAAAGAMPAVVDLYDRAAVVGLLNDAEGAIHTASPGDATSANLDSAVVDAAIDAFAGTGKPYLHITGVWIYGSNSAIDEDSPIAAPAIVAWREALDRRVLAATDIRGVVIASSVAYGDGGEGFPECFSAPRETTPATWSCSARADSAGRPSTSRTWPTPSVARLRTARRVAPTSSAMT